MRVPNAYEEGCCHAPSHIPGRKPLQTSRPDRWTRASLVNRSGRRNSFGHLVDGLRLRLRGIVDPLTGGTAATPGIVLPRWGHFCFGVGKTIPDFGYRLSHGPQALATSRARDLACALLIRS